jgi:hypothetical protein
MDELCFMRFEGAYPSQPAKPASSTTYDQADHERQ